MISWIRSKIDKEFNNQHLREKFVKEQLRKLPEGSKLLDAGAGSQQYRKYAQHLEYLSQDFNQYVRDTVSSFAAETADYSYGQTDIVGDIWDIDVADSEFDAVLCTEVLEHIPYPIETIKELSRVLKPGGTLILTAPSNCLRHMDPYFFTSGFSDRWFEQILTQNDLTISTLEPVGDYFSWMKVELFRTIAQKRLSSLMLLPALAWFKSQRPTQESVASMCMGYHVVAEKSN
jgi:ubiquinone/menaquinone biosynthesis C-methylase UbiE